MISAQGEDTIISLVWQGDAGRAVGWPHVIASSTSTQALRCRELGAGADGGVREAAAAALATCRKRSAAAAQVRLLKRFHARNINVLKRGC